MNGKHSIFLLIAVIAAFFWLNSDRNGSVPQSAESCMRACGYAMVERVTSRGECICKSKR